MTLTADHIEFYSDDEIDKMLALWGGWHEAVESGKEQYSIYPKVYFSFEELIRDRIRRDFLKEEVENWRQ